MRAKKTMRSLLAVFGSLSVSVALAQTSYVAGPVDSVSANATQVTVLGQTYLIDPNTVFEANGKKVSILSGTSLLRNGNLVTVEASVSSTPSKAVAVVISNMQYVAGASQVLVRGSVKQIALEVGTMRIGDLVVDISSTPPEVLSTIDVGSFVEVAGIQPLPQGLLLGMSIAVTPKPATTGKSEIDVDLQSIGGTGSSVSLFSIGGTGKSASLQSIGGTGKSVSLQSIGGTGKSASLQSIGGTGKSASLQSIGGTGISEAL